MPFGIGLKTRAHVLRSYVMILLVFLIAFAHFITAQLQVNTTQGVVQGANAADGSYYTFYGIHYGGNTAGENRFKGPTPPPTYPGLFIAHDNSIFCAQPSARGIIGTEDCLTLNIFTTGTSPAKPVLVWLTGEEYTNADQPGKSYRRLVTEEVVVVQMNYRLSVFGFLCLGVPEAPGNAGLKDVIQGLKWIQQNIAGFGGNPSNVILFGHGSAAAMVDLITLSPLSRNLVHKAIALSGSALAPWAVAYKPIEYARAYGAKFGYTHTNLSDLAKHLASTDITIMGHALNDFEFYNNSILFAPCIENPQLISNETFLADAPINILKSGNYTHVPYIAGYVDREGTLRAEQAAYKQWLEHMQANFTDFLPVDLNFGNNLTLEQKSIKEFYFEERTMNMVTIEDFLDYQGDTLVLVSVIRGARERALTSQSEVRLMEFAYRGTANSDWAFNTIPLDGARHGILLNFLLDYDLTANDAQIMSSVVNRFVAFFNTGSPNPTPSPPNNATWTPINSTTLAYLVYSGGQSTSLIHISSEEIRVNPHVQRMTLWNNIYFKYYVAPQASSGIRVMGFALVLLLSQLFVCLL